MEETSGSYFPPQASAEFLQDVIVSLKQLVRDDSTTILAAGPIEVKILLGRQLHDEAQIVKRMLERHTELGGESDNVNLDREYVMSQAKTTAGALVERATSKTTLNDHIANYCHKFHPHWDEPTVRLIQDAQSVLREHASDLLSLSCDIQEAVGEPEGGLLAALSHRTALPARDRRFEVVEKVGPRPSGNDLNQMIVHSLHHILMGTEIPTIEACAGLLIDFPDMPWDFSVDMARQAWDEARHAQSCIDRLHQLGGVLGILQVDYCLWRMTAGRDLALRLAIHQRIGEWVGVDVALGLAGQLRSEGDTITAQLFDFIICDEITHVAFGNKWIRRTTASQEEILSLQQMAEAVREEHGQASISNHFPLMVDACRRAGMSEEEITYLERKHAAHRSATNNNTP